ncbi:MAG: hypothetical protein HY518_02555 [Candidatus Aenigmarchaeota archaeon]|nr:hypothetical protein [Candidatus Aenigmarchaeota archaeon]
MRIGRLYQTLAAGAIAIMATCPCISNLIRDSSYREPAPYQVATADPATAAAAGCSQDASEDSGPSSSGGPEYSRARRAPAISEHRDHPHEYVMLVRNRPRRLTKEEMEEISRRLRKISRPRSRLADALEVEPRMLGRYIDGGMEMDDELRERMYRTLGMGNPSFDKLARQRSA